MTLGLWKDGGGRVSRIIRECEKVLRGQLAAGRGSQLLNLLKAPLLSMSALRANS